MPGMDLVIRRAVEAHPAVRRARPEFRPIVRLVGILEAAKQMLPRICSFDSIEVMIRAAEGGYDSEEST